MNEKKQLIRVVKNKESEIFIDLSGKKNGRGAYLCNDVKCFQKAKKSRAIERAFAQKIDEIIYNQMEEEILKNE